MSASALFQQRRAARRIGIYTPVLIALATAGVLGYFSPDLPAAVPTHWDSTGVDGYTSRVGFVVGAPVLIALSSLPSAFFALISPAWSNMHRILLSLAVGVAVLVGTLSIGIMAAARSPVAGSEPSLFLPLIAGALAWLAAWAVSPAAVAHPILAPAASEAPTQAVASTWEATVTPDGPLYAFLGISLVPFALFTVWMSATQVSGWWIMVLTFLATALLLTAMLAFRIHISPAGFSARSVLGWPRVIVPAHEIASVVVQQIDPLGDFGGWGLRWGRKRLGLVFRTGPGIIITQHNGRVIGVTMNDAEEACAALLTAVNNPE